MTRFDRIPCGHAAKEWKVIEDMDCAGRTIDSKEEEGFYYLWRKGTHILGGQESIDTDLFKPRDIHYNKDRVGLDVS